MSMWLRASAGGATWDICKQDEEAECGFCAVAMVVNLHGGGKPLTRGMIQQYKGEYDRSTRDRAGMTATPLAAVAESQGEVHHGIGTYIATLARALADYGIPAAPHDNDHGVKTAMRHATRSRPVIVLVNWNGGGGHWVVIAGRKTHGLGSSSTYTILDPLGYAVQNKGSSVYSSPSGSGSFAPYYLTT